MNKKTMRILLCAVMVAVMFTVSAVPAFAAGDVAAAMVEISLCMIVKNEEDVLARCLESVQGIADEIIVVDTAESFTEPFCRILSLDPA